MSELNILEIRKSFKMTQQEFAELIGVDRRTVINYEQGKKIPTSKIKILEMIVQNKSLSIVKENNDSKQSSVLTQTEVEDFKTEILDLKDHIKTLKEYIEEKKKMAEMYINENAALREKLDLLTKNNL